MKISDIGKWIFSVLLACMPEIVMRTAYRAATEGLLIELYTIYFKITCCMPTVQLETLIFPVLNVVSESTNKSKFFLNRGIGLR